MQFFKQSSAIIFASFLTGLSADAAVLKDSSGPAEIPPASFTSKQYVDSKGCVFVRAGVGSNVTWVPRVTRDRELVCGYAPSLSRSAPTSSVQTQSTTASKPSVNPTNTAAVATAAQSEPMRKVVRAPAPTPAPAPTVAASAQLAPKKVYQQPAVVPTPRLPKGYKPVWDDGRLNPYRGQRTAKGEASMRLVWTDTVPRRLVPETGQDGKLVQAHVRYRAANGTTTGTKTAPTRKTSAKSTGQYIQVGAFRASGSVDSTARKFNKMGLPVASRKITQNGQNLKVLYLGPFASAADLNAGLSAAHSAGFTNAFIK